MYSPTDIVKVKLPSGVVIKCSYRQALKCSFEIVTDNPQPAPRRRKTKSTEEE